MTDIRTIEVARKAGSLMVDAAIYGQLAVHPSMTVDGLSDTHSNITHIASGTALRHDICNETVVGYVEQLATFDWDAYVTAGKPAPNVWFGDRFSELRGILIDIDNACDCEG